MSQSHPAQTVVHRTIQRRRGKRPRSQLVELPSVALKGNGGPESSVAVAVEEEVATEHHLPQLRNCRCHLPRPLSAQHNGANDVLPSEDCGSLIERRFEVACPGVTSALEQ